jgi:hypothetical protein
VFIAVAVLTVAAVAIYGLVASGESLMLRRFAS